MRAIVTTVLEVAGVGLVVAGVAFFSVAAALIVAGVAVLLGCWRVAS